MSIAVLLVLYFLFGSNRHIAHTASQQATKRLRSSCAFLRVATLSDYCLHLVKQPFFNNSFMFALVDFAAIAEMPIVKRVCQHFLDLVFVERLFAFGHNALI
ncbi:hypothetical protein IPP92_00830 [Candidatus Saccharibacteria bacterium]|nr:MAG: hypothetical protein IPP92_00830 [Candidatus Saccharibacteria bacterium]